MGKAKVAITGIGAICGMGHTINNVWENALAGNSGITTFSNRPEELFARLPIKFGGEVKDFTIDEGIILSKDAKKYDDFIHFALHSTHEAFLDSGLKEGDYPGERMGSILGVGMGGFPAMEKSHSVFSDRGSRRVTPFFIPSCIPNMTTGLISIKYGLKGTNYTTASACASSGHALSNAMMEIKCGRHDVIISGGSESVLCALPISGFANMKALSRRADAPNKASRPFDIDRDGFVIAEGSAILILENLEKAKARGAKIYAELIGVGATSDAHHITAPHPEGEGAIRCMQQALDSAGIPKDAIGHINAHGTSTPLGDVAETKAVKEVFGDHAPKIHITSTKSMSGHLLGAASALESIFTIMALNKGIIPPTINLENQDPKCDLNYVANKALTSQVEYAINNSFGFGGTNSTLVFKKYNS